MITQTVTVKEKDTQNIIIGRRGTWDTEEIVFDISYLIATYGAGVATLMVKRPGDTTAYPAVTAQEGNNLTWTIGEVDTSYKGHGECELYWYVGEALAKSVIYGIAILRDIGETSETPPDPYESWIDTLTELGAETLENAQKAEEAADDAVAAKTAAETAQDNAEDAAETATQAAENAQSAVEHYPKIENGYWYVWLNGDWVNTGVKAEGSDGKGIASVTGQKTSTVGLVDTYTMTITYTDSTTDTLTFTVTNGANGVSPTVTITPITGGNQITITDAEHPTGQTFEVLDGEVTEAELDEVKATLSRVENGVNENMTAGNAMQLESYIYAEDKVPYLFRRTGGDVQAGAREEDCIVGATVAWNQLIQNGNFASATGWSISGGTGSVSVNNNKGTITGTTSYYLTIASSATKPALSGHKYLICAYLSSSSGKATIIPIDSGSAGNKALNDIANETFCYYLWNPSDNYTNKFAIRFNVTSSGTSEEITATIRDYMCVDLTQMFGSIIADRAYALEQATAGSGIAWLKSMGFFTKNYYAYDAGSLQSVKVGSHKTVGFNQWDEEWESGSLYTSTGLPVDDANKVRSKNFIPVIVAQYYFKYTRGGTIYYYTMGKEFIKTNVLNANTVHDIPKNTGYVKFTIGSSTSPETSIPPGVLCFNISDPAKNGTYEPYVSHSYPLDTTKEWRGIFKLDANNKLYADGDVYPPNGEAARKYGIVDLGTLNYIYSSGSDFMASLSALPAPSLTSGMPECILASYYKLVGANELGNQTVPSYTLYQGRPYFTVTGYTDPDEFKTAMSGVYLVYKLATPTNESADPYRGLQICSADGTEEYTDYAVVAGTRDMAVPVGHDTKYPPDQVKKLDGLPWDLSMIAPIENGTTASQAYTTGQYFLHNNLFCKALTSIASGATFTLNTNYAVTTVAAELYAAINS